MKAGLERLVAADLARPLPGAVAAFAARLAERFAPAKAVLFYGSCLRDGARDGLLDFYVLTARPLGLADRIVGPTVRFVAADGLRAKVAVMPLSRFRAAMDPMAPLPYLWARFSQPVGLAWVEGPEAEAEIRSALAQALAAAAWWAERLSPAGTPAEAAFATLFRHSYGAELRAERADRPARLVEAAPERWRQAARLAFSDPSGDERRRAPAAWSWRHRLGRLAAAARLAKAAFTVQGGADYIAWKVERHSGRPVRLTDWQRRHPLLAAPRLLLSMKRQGLIR